MRNLIQKNIRTYDRIVEEYHSNTKKFERPNILLRKKFLFMLTNGKKILDLGCGPGRDANFFSKRGCQVLGIDLSKKMIEKARKVAPRAKFRIMDFTKLRLNESNFDGVWFEAGLLCVPKKIAGKVLKSIYRFLRKDGIFYVSVKRGRGEGFEFDKRYSLKKYYAYYSKNELRNLLKKSKFKIIKEVIPNLKSKYHTHQWMTFLCKKL